MTRFELLALGLDGDEDGTGFPPDEEDEESELPNDEDLGLAE